MIAGRTGGTHRSVTWQQGCCHNIYGLLVTRIPTASQYAPPPRPSWGNSSVASSSFDRRGPFGTAAPRRSPALPPAAPTPTEHTPQLVLPPDQNDKNEHNRIELNKLRHQPIRRQATCSASASTSTMLQASQPPTPPTATTEYDTGWAHERFEAWRVHRGMVAGRRKENLKDWTKDIRAKDGAGATDPAYAHWPDGFSVELCLVTADDVARRNRGEPSQSTSAATPKGKAKAKGKGRPKKTATDKNENTRRVRSRRT
jgi:hypothetical protein